MPEKEILSKNLVNYRKAHHLSQFEMAEECGISKEALSLMERQAVNPTLETLQKVAAYTDWSVAQLITSQTFKYYVVKQQRFDKDNGNYTSYGIGAIMMDDEVCEITTIISDVFLHKKDAKNFVKKCNQMDLDPLHLYDVVIDIINA